MILFGAFVLGSHLLIAVADGVPSVDINKTCADTAGLAGGARRSDMDSCMTDERDAHSLLVKRWPQYADIDKQRCVRASSDYLPSYVELLTCLEIAKQARSLPDDETVGIDNEAR